MVIREQTVDGRFFLVANCTTGEEGKVPVEYVDISEYLVDLILIVTGSHTK